MDIRKIAVAGGFAVATALTSAPLASADPLTDTVDSEISTLNSIFVSEVAISGGPTSGEIITHGANTFDTTTLQYAPDSGTPTLLDYEMYGLDPLSNASSDPGAYDVFNGALVEFDDALNVEVYSVLNAGALPPAADLIGSATTIAEGLRLPVDDSSNYFFTFGVENLLGYVEGFQVSSLF
jgi:hypothetical protein